MASIGQVSSQVLQRMQTSGSIRCCLTTWAGCDAVIAVVLIETHVLEIDRLTVDADHGRCNPVGKLARLDHAPHQGCDKTPVLGRRPPVVFVRLPLLVAQPGAVGRDAYRSEGRRGGNGCGSTCRSRGAP